MSYRYEKEQSGDRAIVIDGWEKGIAPSPHKGIANMQNVNISTESGEVMISYGRTQQTATSLSTTGSLTFSNASHVNLSMANSNNNFKGNWITVSNSSHSGELANGTYYVMLTAGGGFVLDTTYPGSGIGGYTAGLTADFVLLRTMGTPLGYATEKYSSGSSTYYRYYVLDNQGLVWVYDSVNEGTFSATDNVSWFLPDNSSSTPGTTATGIAVMNGWLHVFAGYTIWCKPTVLLGTSSPGWNSFASGIMTSPAITPNPHYAYVGHQGKLYYTDGNFIGSIFPNTSLLTNVANIQSYASYSASTVTGTASLIGGSTPTTAGGTAVRIPAVFFTGGTLPSAISASTIYYIEYSNGAGTFQVFAAASGGSALDIQTGSSGTQYFNTYNPTASGGKATITFTPQRLNLPFFETATAIVEVGNTVVIGTTSSILYPWNQIDPIPGDLIPLPENNVSYMLTVNNMAYIFAGNRGNIYLTNGSAASLALTVPDYCAGIAGTENTYVEAYFIWGGASYLRGRVYFSVLDQTAVANQTPKAGNCGGIWSFVPTQNFFIGQDFGLSLRLENQNSYGSYNGVAAVIIPSQVQTARSPQYWSAWYSSVSSPTYGIDFVNSSTFSTVATIETDLIPTGTMLDKKTFSQIEYKLSAPLFSGETVTISYRKNSTDAYVSCGSVNTETSTNIAGYFPADFEKSQWLQLKITLTGSGNSLANTSFVRLKEIRIR